MKGIILAGGNGTRLYPTTYAITKHLLPIYDKPMIMYPLSVLMLGGIKDIMLISTERDIERFKYLFGNGNSIGINIEYKIQKQPNGLAESILISEDFIGNSSITLILGDNIFYGQGFSNIIKECIKSNIDYGGATIFAYPVNEPSRFGVVEFDGQCNVLSIEEKPKKPKSNYAITGLYIYDNSVINIAKQVRPSYRNELEITDVNLCYLKNKTLKTKILGRGFTWLDAGTPESMLEASNFVFAIENRQKYKIACLEEIAYINGWIDKKNMERKIISYKNSPYGEYLNKILNIKSGKSYENK